MDQPSLPWSRGADFLWNRMQKEVRASKDGIGLNQALDFLVSNYPDLVKDVGLVPAVDRLAAKVHAALTAGDGGKVLTADQLSGLATRWARERGKEQLYERDLVAAILESASIPIRPHAVAAAAVPAVEGRRARAKTPAAGPPEPVTRPEAGAPAGAPTAWRPRAVAPTLEALGRDLTAEAAAGELAPIVARDAEIDLLVETLCRPSKPNALLLGPAGVGKTAIVEGLARRVVAGEVPAPLRDVRIFALQTADLVQGMGVVGELEKRMRLVLAEAEQAGVIVFLDEIHTVVGAGAGGRGGDDVANLLKPALGRSRMLCIGATTDSEYSRHLASDTAFERRFQLVRVQEMTSAAAREVLRSRAATYAERSGVAVDEPTLDLVISLAQRFLRHRRFPDKAIDILDQAVGRAIVTGASRCEPESVREVVARMVGVPVAAGEREARLARLRSELVAQAGLQEDEAEHLTRRLRVTLADLDVRPGRPNAVVAVPGLERAGRLAATIAECLYGDAVRVVEEDLSTFTHPADVSRLVGAAPGYVGHGEPLRLNLALRQQPWSVVLLRGVDLAHPAVQAVLATVLTDGVLHDARGEAVWWSDCVCVLGLAEAGGAVSHRVGFLAAAGAAALPAGPGDAARLEPALAACVDLSCSPGAGAAAPTAGWVVRHLLEPVARRLEEELDSTVTWPDGFAEWVAARAGAAGMDAAHAERWFEETVVAALVSAAEQGAGVSLRPRVGADGQLEVGVEQGRKTKL